MAFGNGSRSFGSDSILYSFKIKTKNLPAPHFEVYKKIGDKYEKLAETATRVSGNLIAAAPKENSFEGKTIKSVNLTLQDGKDIYFVNVGYTFLGRNLFNALLNLKAYDQVEIGLYQSKPKPGATDTRGFASVSLRQGDGNEIVRGKFDYKTELPATKKIRVNGQDQTDTYDLDCFFEEKMKAWCKDVNAASKKSAPSAPASSEEHAPSGIENHHPSNSENLDEEVPF